MVVEDNRESTKQRAGELLNRLRVCAEAIADLACKKRRMSQERVAKRRGKKIGRLVVARLLLRSIFKVLRDGVPFSGDQPTAPTSAATRP